MRERNVRPDVGTPVPAAGDSPWDDRALHYARAVGVMQGRAPEDPTSWAAQAALQRACPRGTWFFLPWLRMQLWYFERIVRAIVVENGGPPGWAQPFWGYDAGGASAALPAAFVAPTLPDGAPNPLYRPVGERPAPLNAGRPLPDAVTSAARALAARTFAPGFGGNPGVPGDTSEPAPAGILEAQPHDAVAAVLGPNAALDPVFPLHLANVDRLWEVWLARGEGRANPPPFDWSDRAFWFSDADGRPRSLTCGQVGDLANLDYAYAGVPARAASDRVLKAGADRGPLVGYGGFRSRIAAGDPDGVRLGSETRRVALSAATDGPADPSVSDGARVYLCLEEARGDALPGSVWEVRLEGRGVHGSSDDGAAVGTIAFPGPPDGTHRFVFDITSVVGTARTWDDRSMVVSFHPALPPGFAVEPGPAAQVGRVFVVRS
jgi:tyrosinase